MTENSDQNSAQSLKMKKIKADILKRCKDLEEKYSSEKASSILMHQAKSVMKNIAFWKIPSRGVITSDDVRLAIYQLERDGFIELVDRTHLRLSQRGSKIAEELRSMRLEEIPTALVGSISSDDVQHLTNRCANCGKLIEPDSVFCRHCGSKIKIENEFCTYCGASIVAGSDFCSTCGKKI